MLFSLALAVMFFVWTYLASCMVPDSFYNGFVNRLRSALFRPVTAIQRAIPNLSERGAAAIAFILSLFIAAAVARLFSTGSASSAPIIPFGGNRLALPLRNGPGAALTLAAGKFAVLLGQIALVQVALSWRLGSNASNIGEALDTAIWPLSVPRAKNARLAAAFCTLIAGSALCLISAPTATATNAAMILRVAAVSAIDTLLLLGNFLFVACVLSWVSIVPSSGIQRSWWRETLDLACSFSSEAMSDLMRAVLGNSPLAIGFVSFAPLVACFVLRFIHGIAVTLLIS